MSKKYFAVLLVLFSAFALCPDVFAKYPPVQNERLVMNAMRTIYNAQVQYQASVGAGEFGTFTALRQANLIDAALASGQKYGYYFTVTTNPRTASQPARFFLTAIPRVYRKTGIRSFYIDHRCSLRGADKNGAAATINDPAIEPCVPAIIGQNEARVIQAIRAYHSAQMTFQSTVGAGTFGTLSQLFQAGLISPELAAGHYSGYVFLTAVIAPTSTTPALFWLRAIPSSYGETGIRSFYIDQTGVLRGADKNGGAADPDDPPIEN